ncbi:MAG: glycosyltransferase family 2 protein [Candidatus Kerfeldbacteria bacterium]|jgi:cellulose synthase/poly-beta-1,6-N-acetylglucosamine synthase-like glycosyltransferase
MKPFELTDYRKYRFLEIIPGVAMWGTFAITIGLSFIQPMWAIYFIIVFDTYWVIRIGYMLLFMIISYVRYRKTIKVDWLQKVQEKENWNKYYHLVFLPTFQEPYEVLVGALRSLENNKYPLDKLIVVLAGEEKDKENFLKISKRLQEEFNNKFFKFVITIHPANQPGEVAGKGSNIAYAGKKLREMVDRWEIPYENIIVSSFDSDTYVHHQYFTYLTYRYITHPNPTRVSFQPLAFFNNNVWDSPALTRVISYSTTFWLMTEQSRPERMFTFSSHSMSFRALVDVGFWQSDIVTEDSRISMQCVMEYDGDYEVVALPLPVSMDVVLGSTFWETVKAQYFQQRRWAYGVENFPYMVWNFGHNKKMPFIKKFRYIFNQSEGIYSWSTAPLLIFVLGYLPIWIANTRGLTSVAAQNAPEILQFLMTAGMVGLVVQAILSSTLLPGRPKHHKPWRFIWMILQWVLVPITLILFGSFPAIDAQTRLMLGKYLSFHVTKKVRK